MWNSCKVHHHWLHHHLTRTISLPNLWKVHVQKTSLHLFFDNCRTLKTIQHSYNSKILYISMPIVTSKWLLESSQVALLVTKVSLRIAYQKLFTKGASEHEVYYSFLELEIKLCTWNWIMYNVHSRRCGYKFYSISHFQDSWPIQNKHVYDSNWSNLLDFHFSFLQNSFFGYSPMNLHFQKYAIIEPSNVEMLDINFITSICFV